MDNTLSFVADIAIRELMHHPAGEKLKKAADVIQTVYDNLSSINAKDESIELTAIKSTTVMAFAILKRIANGVSPNNFTKTDWKEIANEISEYAVIPSGCEYSVFVFSLYEKYIRFSTEMIDGVVPESILDAVNALADELHLKAELLSQDEITESQYTEDCLWISLEAMVKLLASTSVLCVDKRIVEFAPALADLAFEYGRMKLYRRELEIVNQFIESQYQLDSNLSKQYAEYIESLNAQAAQFYTLIDNAFSLDFRKGFLGSVILAGASGVKSDEILSDINDIDSFFLD